MTQKTMTKEMLKTLKKTLKVPFKELKISSGISLVFFEVGTEPYYIKIVS